MDAKIDSLAKDADIICTKIATFQAKREESVRKVLLNHNLNL
jgi:hypothetical protein